MASTYRSMCGRVHAIDATGRGEAIVRHSVAHRRRIGVSVRRRCRRPIRSGYDADRHRPAS